MEHAEETDVGGIEPVTDTAVPRRGYGILTTIMVVNVGVVLALAWLTYNMSAHLERTHGTLRTQLETTSALEKKVAAISLQQGALEKEVGDLRQFVASRSEEDVIFLKIVVTKRDVDRDLARQIARHVHKYSQIYGQDPDLVLAIMKVESDYDPNAVSHMGATGLMQVMPQWKQVLGIRENLTDPETSVRYGLQILGFYRNMYKDLEMALTAYNRGPGPVDMALMRGKSPLNRYAPKVLETYKELQSLRVGTKEMG
jgi:soluble lytic murein transglycosylase-like protein